MADKDNIVVSTAGSSFPAFTVAALILVICKFTAYPAISWWLIIGVWSFPLLFVIAFFSFILIMALIISGIALLVVGITALFTK
jgi:hypothetical protein